MAPSDPLPSWNNVASKQNILRFVADVTTAGGPYYVPPEERIAVFDNDGTLWAEKPTCVQVAFAKARVKPQYQRPWAPDDERGSLEALAASYMGLTTDEYAQLVLDWMATARNPETNRLYTDMVYQPMLELLAWLRANGFKTFIVSGGGAEFMRPWAESVYGIPPEQIVGSSVELEYLLRGDTPVLVRTAKIHFVDNNAGKPVGIEQHIGRRPIAAFGNSDGDLQMLQWASASGKRTFGLLVHHTDAQREWAYESAPQALSEAPTMGWTVMDMKQDWKVVFSQSQAHAASARAAGQRG